MGNSHDYHGGTLRMKEMSGVQVVASGESLKEIDSWDEEHRVVSFYGGPGRR